MQRPGTPVLTSSPLINLLQVFSVLCPSPVTPGHIWLWIWIDTGLPNSHGKLVILTIVDHFFKVVCFVTLPNLPSAFESGDGSGAQPWMRTSLILHHVFCLQGIPVDIVSDQGHQFAYWKEFYSQLGAMSEFHHQFNGQTECKIWEMEMTLFSRILCRGQNSCCG